MNFFTSIESKFYKQISDWIGDNSTEDFYIYPSQQSDENIYDFCSAVLDKNKIPILIVPTGGWDKKYPSTLQGAINLSDKVRVYESAKMGTKVVLNNRAEQFIKINGGVVWIH